MLSPPGASGVRRQAADPGGPRESRDHSHPRRVLVSRQFLVRLWDAGSGATEGTVGGPDVRAVAGAIVVLAGAVVFAGGAVAEAVSSSGQHPTGPRPGCSP